jgi:hypothetical protein
MITSEMTAGEPASAPFEPPLLFTVKNGDEDP